jgi:hypothetical protein
MPTVPDDLFFIVITLGDLAAGRLTFPPTELGTVRLSSALLVSHSDAMPTGAGACLARPLLYTLHRGKHRRW